MSPKDKKKLNKLRVKLDKLDNSLISLIKKRTGLVEEVLSLKKYKHQIVDKRRIAIILKNIRNKSKLEAEENLKEAEKFLAENKTNKNIKETPSGLQYRVIKEGDGETPVKDDKVKVHYVGKLLNGSEFDNSIERGEPTEFGLNQVIKGWTEGLQLMNSGAKYEFFIHPRMAYGARSRPQIPGNSLLIFEVELIEVINKK